MPIFKPEDDSTRYGHFINLHTIFKQLLMVVNKPNQKEKIRIKYEDARRFIERFESVLRKYTNITELDAHILNELINKIVVHEKEIINGQRTQRVDIYYKFVGRL